MNNQLPSIEDLLKQNAPATKAPAPQPADNKAPPATVLTEKMRDIELKGKEAEAKQLAASLGVNYIDLSGFPISPDALTRVPEAVARELKALCFLFTGPELRLAAVVPQDQKVKDLLFQLEERNKTNGELYLISQDSFDKAVKLYATLPKVRPVVKGVQIKEEELQKYQEAMNNMGEIASVLHDANATDILAIVIAAALKLNSSDIHIEAEEKGIAVRFRVDGILQEVAVLDKEDWKKIINRIKLIAGLKLNIIDRPQDGRFSIFQKETTFDVRTSTVPTSWGESVVMRILNPATISLDLANLGFRPPLLDKLMREIQKPTGMIVTTGPTGSGKTTTLYAVLKHLNTPEVKIITLEDPVEYKLEGINQTQIDHTKEFTFASALRSVLRQDPDIVMVGEIRDLETAETSIQAALTGHLMLSTIHTNDAAGAIPRFISMGVKAFLLAPALNAVMGQRLARRLCEECKAPAQIDEAVKARAMELLSTIPENSGEKPNLENPVFFTSKGCPACSGTGFKGRVGLYEILLKDKDVEQMILNENVSEYAMREVAQKQGMITMAQDGLLKALDGLTSVEEVQRITGF